MIKAAFNKGIADAFARFKLGQAAGMANANPLMSGQATAGPPQQPSTAVAPPVQPAAPAAAGAQKSQVLG